MSYEYKYLEEPNMTFKIAIVEWVDSTYYTLDFSETDDEIQKSQPKILISCGFLVFEDENCIVISQDIVKEMESKRTIMSIPKISIKNYSIKKINLKEIVKK